MQSAFHPRAQRNALRRRDARQQRRLFAGATWPHLQTDLVCPSARAMQDGVRLALLHFLQQLTDFQCGRRNDLDTAPSRLR